MYSFLYVRRARVSVCVCLRVSICMFVRVWRVWVLPLLHVHSLYDTTMTRLSRLEKGGGALARRRRPNSYSMFAKRRFYSLSLFFSPPFLLSPLSRSRDRPSDPRLGRATTVRSSFLEAEPGEKLLGTPLISSALCVSPFSVFFFF